MDAFVLSLELQFTTDGLSVELTAIPLLYVTLAVVLPVSPTASSGTGVVIETAVGTTAVIVFVMV
ncbi:hypothetical protein LJK89_003171 [Vibrio parahaemolyticus]|nr:hypothetical protein [Vibrio parahaemolyticus]ELB2741062.1 hypothetical protein [Vibrio parahaemolyticus]